MPGRGSVFWAVGSSDMADMPKWVTYLHFFLAPNFYAACSSGCLNRKSYKYITTQMETSQQNKLYPPKKNPMTPSHLKKSSEKKTGGTKKTLGFFPRLAGLQYITTHTGFLREKNRRASNDRLCNLDVNAVKWWSKPSGKLSADQPATGVRETPGQPRGWLTLHKPFGGGWCLENLEF